MGIKSLPGSPPAVEIEVKDAEAGETLAYINYGRNFSLGLHVRVYGEQRILSIDNPTTELIVEQIEDLFPK